MKKPVVYVAGPMTGLPDYNYPAFHAAAKQLRESGLEVLNPAEHFGGDQTLSYAAYMRAAIEALLKADAIFMLPGWEGSRGARMERMLADRLGLRCLNPQQWLDGLRGLVLDVAFCAPTPNDGSSPETTDV